MTEKKKYYIRIEKNLIEVSEEIYRCYHQMGRHERYLTEKEKAHNVLQYSNFDTDELLGEEMIPDFQSTSVEDHATTHILSERLHQCITLLPKSEQRLLQAIYGDGMSEHQLSRKIGIPQKTINNRKRQILAKLKKLLQQ